MTAAEFKAWMDINHLTKSQAATRLGLARSTLDRYLDGVSVIPKYISLACETIGNDKT
jgi:transcriptional regulator with XRE-family HTH domain